MFRLDTALTHASRNALYGPVIGEVTNNCDPEGKYRVKVKYPTLPDADQSASYWARICTLGAGPGRGIYMLPDVGDEVLVAFVQGRVDQPFVIGAVHNGKNKEWRDNAGNQADCPKGENFVAGYRSKCGHVIEFNNDPDHCKITIRTAKGHVVELSDENDTCTVATADGANYIILDQPGKQITLSSEGDVLIQAGKCVTIKGETIKTESSHDTSMQAKNLEAHADSKVEIKSSGTSEFASTGPTKMTGMPIQLNP